MWKLLILILMFFCISLPADNVFAAPPTVADFSDISTIDKLPKGINYIPKDTIVWMQEESTGHETIDFSRTSNNTFRFRVNDISIRPGLKNKYPVRLYTLKEKLTEDDINTMTDLTFKELVALGIWVETESVYGELSKRQLNLELDNSADVMIKDTSRPYMIAFGESITYSGVTNKITVMQDTSDFFEDIYQADLLGGWGVVTKQGSTQYYFQAGVICGDNTNPYLMLDTNKNVTFWSHGIANFEVLRILANTTLNFGTLLDADTHNTGDGCSFHFEEPTQPTYFCFTQGTCNLYGCSIYPTTHLLIHYVDRMYNCFCGYRSQLIAVDDSYNIIMIDSSLYRFGWAITSCSNLFANSSEAIIHIRTTYDITSENVIANTTGNYMLYISNSSGAIDELVNYELNKWTFTLGSSYDGNKIYRQYTVDIKVVDENGNEIEGANVTLTDQYGTEVFSTTTNATGQIREQIVTYILYEPTSTPTAHVVETTYSPHTLTVEYDGYYFIRVIDDLDHPINWVVGGEDMTELSESMTILAGFVGNFSNAFIGLIYLSILVVISIIAFWKSDHAASTILFLIAFGLSWMIGLNAPDLIDGNAETTVMGLSLGLMFMFYGLFCAVMVFRLMFWESKE